MKDFKKTFGGKVKNVRESRGLSQEDLAVRLGISRVSISQIENGERKISAEEVVELAKFFNMSVDVLLDLEKDIKIILQKEKDVSIKRGQETRINVPQKNVDKFKEILLYILGKVGSKSNVGETVIYKLLYFIDFDFYEKYEEQLMGATYIKNHYGPTPVEFKSIVEEMEKEEKIMKVESEYFKYPQTKYLPLKEVDLTKLKAHEQAVIDHVLEELAGMNAQGISTYSHGDVPWLATEKGEIIDYESVFYRTTPYSVRRDDIGDGEGI